MELRDVWHAAMVSWWLVAAATLSCLSVALLVAFYMTPVYRAEVVMIPTDSERMPTGAVGSLVQEFSGLAAVAGLTTSSVSKKDEALSVLRSRSFTQEVLEKHDLLKELFAEDWDSVNAAWRVPVDEVPTIRDGIEEFDRRIRSISEDGRTGVVTLAIEWRDPSLAAEWANLLVSEVNERLRNRAILEAQRSIDFLNAELEKTSVVELQRAIFGLIESQVSDAMIANVRPEYAFRVIDPAMPPDSDDFVRPQRLLIAGAGFVLGLALGLLIAILRFGDSGSE